MPPHDPEIRMPFGTTWTTTNFDEITASPNIHTTTNNPYENWITVNSPYTDWVSNSLNIHADASQIDTEILGKKVRIALDKVLDQYFRKLYEIINDVHNFSISEDEFMKLLKED